MKTVDGEKLVTGLHLSNSFSKIYNTFVSKKTDEADLDIFLVDGMLSFEKTTNEFKLGSPAKAYGESYEGNVMTYNNETSTAKYDGKFSLIKPDKNFRLQASGNMTARLDSSRARFDSFLAFDINLPGNAWAQMGQFILSNVEGLPEAIDNSTALFYKMGEFIGNRGVMDYAAKTTTTSVPFTKVSPKLIHSLVFNDVKLKWSARNNAWYSVGKLSLANIDKKDINAQIAGYIEIKRVGESDVISIYLEASPTAWYYINYNENALTVASSDDKFNQSIVSKFKPAGTVANTFTPIAGEGIDRNQFVTYFRNTYLGGKGEPLVDYKPAPTVDPTTEETPAEDDPAVEGEEGTAKKGKKKKGKATEDTDAATEAPIEDAPIDTPAEGEVAEKPAKKKKKEKVKTEEDPALDAPVDTPVDTPDEPVVEKKKKKDKEKTEEPPAEVPADNAATEPPAEEPVKKKKKEKVKTEEPPADDAPADEAPAEEPVKKKKKEKAKKEEEQEADVDMAP
jgi:hypothetical protein